METETSFGALISRRRKALGLLQKELALQVGCSVAGLQKIERDERRPSRAMAERLAEALDVHADERAMFVLVARGERLIERLPPVAEPSVPMAVPAIVTDSVTPVPASRTFARPKSMIFSASASARRFSSGFGETIITFSGFRSRWTMPMACAN